MVSQWLIIGASGATCSGKTTLTRDLKELLPDMKVLSQDNYFLPIDSPQHTLIPELNHFNWEILSSLDMEKMYTDIRNIVGEQTMKINTAEILDAFKKWTNRQCENKTEIFKNDVHLIKNKLGKYNINILLIEGFSIFNYAPIDEICHLKFFLTISKETCFERRNKRTYDPPDVPGYFEMCVWPEYIRQLQEVRDKSKNVIYFNEDQANVLCALIFDYLLFFFKNFCK